MNYTGQDSDVAQAVSLHWIKPIPIFYGPFFFWQWFLSNSDPVSKVDSLTRCTIQHNATKQYLIFTDDDLVLASVLSPTQYIYAWFSRHDQSCQDNPDGYCTQYYFSSVCSKHSESYCWLVLFHRFFRPKGKPRNKHKALTTPDSPGAVTLSITAATGYSDDQTVLLQRIDV